MGRTKQTNRKSLDGKAPRKSLAGEAARMSVGIPEEVGAALRDLKSVDTCTFSRASISDRVWTIETFARKPRSSMEKAIVFEKLRKKCSKVIDRLRDVVASSQDMEFNLKERITFTIRLMDDLVCQCLNM
jgi:hypothetical protein